CELHAEMAKTADALNRHDIASARTRIAQRVEGGNASAEQRRGVDGIELIGDRCERLDRRDHVVGIAAVEVNAGNPEVAAGDEVAAPAAGARPANPPEPADADPLARAPVGDLRSQGVDPAGDLVTRDGGKVDPGVSA